MHNRFLAMLCLTATAVTAQSLTTTFVADQSLPAGGAIYFDLSCTHPAGIEISSLVLHFADPASTPGTVDIYAAPTGSTLTDPWSLIVGNIAVTAAGPGAPTPAPIALPSPLTMGSACSFRLAVVAHGLQHAYSTTAPLVYSNADLTLTAGESSDAAFSGSPHTPSVPNCVVFYHSGGTCLDAASATPVGDGCQQLRTSTYELFAPGPVDFGTLRFHSDPSVGGLPLPSIQVSTFSTPTGSLTHSASAQLLSLGDDDQVSVGSLGITVGSNGWIAFGPGNSNFAFPFPATMLANPSMAFYAWKDLDPSAPGGGRVWYSETADPSSGVVNSAEITFEGVYAYGTTDPNTVQFSYFTQLDVWPHPIVLHVSFGTISSSGTPLLVGYSPGGASLDPGSVDFTPVVPFWTDLVDAEPLALTPIGRPILQSPGVPFQVTTSDIPASALVHLGIIGLINPAAPLDVLLGMPECNLYADLMILTGTAYAPFPTGSVTWNALGSLAPSSTHTAGLVFYAQSLILGTDLNTALGLGALTSNGVRCELGWW